MRIAFTVAPWRVTPVDEVGRLAEMIVPGLEDLGEVEAWQPEPLPWLDWVRGQPLFRGPEGFDLVVGFELPRGVQMTVPAWIDIREHPVHFAGQLWSITSSANLAPAIAPRAAGIPFQERLADYGSFGAFACQVSFDQALMQGARLIRPPDVIEGFRGFAHRFEGVYVCPSPREPRGPWVEAALAIENAIVSPWPTYDTLRRVRNLCTVTSSVGVEAEYFGVETTWLARKTPYSAPIAELEDAALWAEILDLVAGVPA